MNDEGGTLSDLWREERDACMMKEGGKVGVGESIREGGVRVIRECVRCIGDEKGDRKASHRKHTDRANWKRGKFEGRSARTPSLGVRCELRMTVA